MSPGPLLSPAEAAGPPSAGAALDVTPSGRLVGATEFPWRPSVVASTTVISFPPEVAAVATSGAPLKAAALPGPPHHLQEEEGVESPTTATQVGGGAWGRDGHRLRVARGGLREVAGPSLGGGALLDRHVLGDVRVRSGGRGGVALANDLDLTGITSRDVLGLLDHSLGGGGVLGGALFPPLGGAGRLLLALLGGGLGDLRLDFVQDGDDPLVALVEARDGLVMAVDAHTDRADLVGELTKEVSQELVVLEESFCRRRVVCPERGERLLELDRLLGGQLLSLEEQGDLVPLLFHDGRHRGELRPGERQHVRDSLVGAVQRRQLLVDADGVTLERLHSLLERRRCGDRDLRRRARPRGGGDGCRRGRGGRRARGRSAGLAAQGDGGRGDDRHEREKHRNGNEVVREHLKRPP